MRNSWRRRPSGSLELGSLLPSRYNRESARIPNEFFECPFIKVWLGATWVMKPIKTWNGAAWVIKRSKYLDGHGLWK